MRAHLGIRFVLAALLSAALGAFPAAAAGEMGSGPDYFPNVPLTNQDGKVVHFYDDLMKGKNVAVNIIYTHCSASCPLETAKLRQVQKLLGDHVGKDIFFYSISIDPKRDTPAVLKAYAERYHVAPGWQFLTGKQEDINLIAQKLGLTSMTDAVNRDGHQPSLMIGNEATGRWMRNSATDNPRFLAITMSNYFHWKVEQKTQSYASMGPVPTVDRGTYLFKTRCAACHTVGKGDGVGPDLVNVVGRRGHDWVARYVAQPETMLAEGDPVAKELFKKYKEVRMPNLELYPDDVRTLIAYIQKQSGAVNGAAKTAESSKTAGSTRTAALSQHAH